MPPVSVFQVWGSVTCRALSLLFSDLKKKRHPSFRGNTSRACAAAQAARSMSVAMYRFIVADGFGVLLQR